MTDDGVAKILDFGLARLITSSLTRSNVVVGTINYMAPEHLRGERADHRADIFSFGVLLYELLGGRKPFQGDSAAATIYKILHDTPPALNRLDPAIGSPLTTIVERAMAKAPEGRYQRMTDLLRDLEAAYESMRGATAASSAGVEAALRTPSGSVSPKPLDVDPDDSPSIVDETMWPRWVWATLLVAGVVLAGWLVVVAWELGAVRQSPSSVTEVSSAGPAPQATSAPPAVPTLSTSDTPTADVPAPPVPSTLAAREAELSVERTRATAALSLMEASKGAALSANARDLAPQIFAAAEKEEALAREDLLNGDSPRPRGDWKQRQHCSGVRWRSPTPRARRVRVSRKRPARCRAGRAGDRDSTTRSRARCTGATVRAHAGAAATGGRGRRESHAASLHGGARTARYQRAPLGVAWFEPAAAGGGRSRLRETLVRSASNWQARTSRSRAARPR